jgi:mono/diheme cytochrome c family protein
MNEQDKKEYLEKYHAAKEKGVPFFPDIIFKDAVISFLVFILLVGLAFFIGAPLEARANPADTSYTPRPEWYFLFLFQLLKYFPGNLEVLGVVLIPTLAILALFLLPWIDRTAKRDFRSRPFIIAGTTLVVIAIVFLTIQAVREAPPPVEASTGDKTAALYANNCAPCHGESISVPAGTNLHEIIAQGKHEGMPAWGGDLSTDQIDALAGYILSPGGNQLFNQYCVECHAVEDLVSTNPLEIKNSLDLGLSYPPHNNLNIPNFTTALDLDQRSVLLNFLVAPDGERIFSINCAPCHGTSVAFNGTKDELRALISTGGQHVDMPSWKEKLSDAEIATLAGYVVDPQANPSGQTLFEQNCQTCHGDRIPKADSIEKAEEIISTGGSHRSMPVWGSILTDEQLTALTDYTYTASQNTSSQTGQQLFIDNCAPCHGQLGEGGPNPQNPERVLPPITTAEFLKTRNDDTLRAIINLGLPDSGMSPFGAANGGQLDDTQIDSIVAYIRGWESNPLEVPPPTSQPSTETTATLSPDSGKVLFAGLCANCHGQNGEGMEGKASGLISDTIVQKTDQQIYESINNGVDETTMPKWSGIITPDQINLLVEFVRNLNGATSGTDLTNPSFSNDVLPILQAKCGMCHGSMGGWSATDYTQVIESGLHGPSIIPGDPTNSVLVQKLTGQQTFGTIMPPGGSLSETEIQIIVNWILAGAQNN